MMLLARLSPKHGSVSSYQSNITSCARNIITSTGNHAAVRLVASSHIISCRPAARLWQSGIFNKSIISTCIGQSNFDTKGSFRLYSYRNQSRLPLDGCKTVEDVLQLAVKQREKLIPNQNAAMWTYIFRLISKGQRQNFVHKENVAQLELLIWDILEVTMELPRMRPRDLTTITLQLAKIANGINSKHYKRISASELALKNILFDEESNLQPSIFDPLAEAANQIIIDFEPRYLSNLAYAYSLLGYNPRFDNDTTLLENIADASLDCIQQFNAQDISNMMWAYTRLNESHEPLFQAVGDAVVMKDDLATFKPQAISNIVWSYATANVQHSALFKKVSDEIVAMDDLKSYNPQALSNTVWAYATAAIHHRDLFEIVASEIVSMDDLKSFDPQAIADTIWAYAASNIHYPGLFNKIGDEIVAMDDLKSFDPQNLSNIVWACATSNTQHPGLFTKVGDEIVAMHDLKSFKPQELANTVWSYAATNIQHPGLFTKVGDEIVAMDDLKSFKAQELANTVWSYAAANIQHRDLFSKIGAEIVATDNLASFKSQDLANTVWAYATANIQHPSLFKKVADEIAAMDNLKSFNSQNLSNIAWAYTVANLDVSSLFNSSFRQELLERQNEFIDKSCRQLYQWHQWQTKEKSNDGLPDSLRDKCKQSFSSANTTSSALQTDVVSELKSIGLNPIEEYLTESGYSIDAMVEINGNKVGVEVDGLSHFIGQQLNGPTVLKCRQIETIDKLTLVSVPYWEWDKLGKDRNEKQNYLKALLNLKT